MQSLLNRLAALVLQNGGTHPRICLPNLSTDDPPTCDMMEGYRVSVYFLVLQYVQDDRSVFKFVTSNSAGLWQPAQARSQELGFSLALAAFN